MGTTGGTPPDRGNTLTTSKAQVPDLGLAQVGGGGRMSPASRMGPLGWVERQEHGTTPAPVRGRRRGRRPPGARRRRGPHATSPPAPRHSPRAPALASGGDRASQEPSHRRTRRRGHRPDQRSHDRRASIVAAPMPSRRRARACSTRRRTHRATPGLSRSSARSNRADTSPKRECRAGCGTRTRSCTPRPSRATTRAHGRGPRRARSDRRATRTSPRRPRSPGPTSRRTSPHQPAAVHHRSPWRAAFGRRRPRVGPAGVPARSVPSPPRPRAERQRQHYRRGTCRIRARATPSNLRRHNGMGPHPRRHHRTLVRPGAHPSTAALNTLSGC